MISWVKKKLTDVHILLGITIGIIASMIVYVTMSSILWNIKYMDKFGYVDNLSIYTSIAMVCIVVFFSILYGFTNKKSREVKLNKISVYLLLTITISLVMAIIACMILGGSRWYYDIFENYVNSNLQSVITANLAGTVLMICGVGTFIITFLLTIKGRVRYIQFLTKEVKKLQINGFGSTIEVKGNDELSELCQSINSMSLELKERIDKEKQLEKNKTELITNVSHDLRTPLTSIMGYIDLIKNKDYKSQEQLNEYVEIIDEKSKNLNKLINELFEYTKLNNEDIKLNFNEVDIVSLCEQIAGEYVYIFNKEGLTLEKDIVDKEITLNLDIERIVRVLDNLLSNAKKYATKGSVVYVKVFEEGEGINIEISNKTNEIKEEDIKHLFNRFYKGDKSRSESESSGLGLSIAKRIVELHDGTIDVRMVEDVISFRVRLKYQS